MKMFGGPTAKRNKYLSLNFRPCIPIQLTAENRGKVKCGVENIHDFTEMQKKHENAIKYVGNAIITALFTSEVFISDKYGKKERISRTSKI